MLCEVYAHKRSIPNNRGKLLEDFVLVRWLWERERQPDRWIGWPRQQKVLARLAYAMTANHGRGTSVAWDWARRILRQADDAIDPLEVRRLAQAADILEVIADGESIRFSHQLLQEYFAAIALEAELRFLEQPHLQLTCSWQRQQSFWQKKLAQYVAVGRRTGWEETLFLLAGLRENAAYLRELTGQLLSRPLEFAQLLGTDASDAGLREEICGAAQRQIADPALSLDLRIDAGVALRLLGDPRFPVTIAEWRTSSRLLGSAHGFGLPPVGAEGAACSAMYWCHIPAGTYRIGGWKLDELVADEPDAMDEPDEPDEPDAELELPNFWIARFPITVAQYASFVDVGYGPNAERWLTPHGWRWNTARGRTQPWAWDEPKYTGPNQPVIGVTWYEAAAFCAWLSKQLGALLPERYTLRLPTEAEWEVAAATLRTARDAPIRGVTKSPPASG
jgi:hypothetical protein